MTVGLVTALPLPSVIGSTFKDWKLSCKYREDALPFAGYTMVISFLLVISRSGFFEME